MFNPYNFTPAVVTVTRQRMAKQEVRIPHHQPATVVDMDPRKCIELALEKLAIRGMVASQKENTRNESTFICEIEYDPEDYIDSDDYNQRTRRAFRYVR